jgi:hypothetical protein
LSGSLNEVDFLTSRPRFSNIPLYILWDKGKPPITKTFAFSGIIEASIDLYGHKINQTNGGEVYYFSTATTLT